MPLDVHRVRQLYQEITTVLRDHDKIPDEAFDEASYEFQASWDEWGRGYKPAPYALRADGSRIAEDDDEVDALEIKDSVASSFIVRLDWDPSEPAAETFVRVDRMSTRADAVKALHALAKQGEAPH